MPSNYALPPLQGERMYGRVLETVTVEPYKLICRSCTHPSASSPDWRVDPGEGCAKVLVKLDRVNRFDVVRLIEGEPLLRQRLCDVIAAVRGSEVLAEIQLITNCFLLECAEPTALRAADQVNLSTFSVIRIGDAAPRELNALPVELGAWIVKTLLSLFSKLFSVKGTTDETLVRNIYDSCKVVHENRASPRSSTDTSSSARSLTLTGVW